MLSSLRAALSAIVIVGAAIAAKPTMGGLFSSPKIQHTVFFRFPGLDADGRERMDRVRSSARTRILIGAFEIVRSAARRASRRGRGRAVAISSPDRGDAVGTAALLPRDGRGDSSLRKGHASAAVPPRLVSAEGPRPRRRRDPSPRARDAEKPPYEGARRRSS